MAGIVNNGEINLITGADILIDREDDWLWLQRRGNVFFQIRPIGFAQTEKLTKDLDMNGFRAYNGGYRLITLAGPTTTLAPGHRGHQVVNTGNLTVTLPAAQPASGQQWKLGDVVSFRQESANCIFTPAAGAILRNIDAHDRGRGIGAKMEIELIQITPNFVWSLCGMTQLVGGGPATIEREFVTVESLATISTDASSLAWKNAFRLTHTPPDSSTWLYLCHANFGETANQATGLGEARFVNGSSVQGFGMPNSLAMRFAPLLMKGVAYGASPGAQNIDLDIKSGLDTNTVSTSLCRILGLKLEAGEFLQLTAGGVDNVTTTSYTVKCSMTQTFEADDYFVFAWAEFNPPDDVVSFMSIRVVIDGSAKNEQIQAKNTKKSGYYGSINTVLFTAGAKTITIDAKCEGAFNSSIQNMGICVLRADRFQDVATANDGTVTTTASTTYADKVTVTKSLASGWEYLILGDMGLMLDSSTSTTGAKGQLIRNGTRLGHQCETGARVANVYLPVSFGAMEVVQRNLASDVFAVQAASKRTSETATAKEATLLVLSLAQT